MKTVKMRTFALMFRLAAAPFLAACGGSPNAGGGTAPQPADVSQAGRIISVSAGNNHTMALRVLL
jgi:hypothetical protein